MVDEINVDAMTHDIIKQMQLQSVIDFIKVTGVQGEPAFESYSVVGGLSDRAMYAD